MQANELINRCRDLIQDIDSERWSDAELIRWLNDAQIEVVRVRPQANAGMLTKPLSSGTGQTLPTEAIILIRFVSNGSVGSYGKIPMPVDLNQMDRADPSWRMASATVTVEHVMIDPAHDIFHVYPPNTGAGSLVLECGLYPTALSSSSSTVGLDDEYANALVNYAAYRALMKDGDKEPSQAAQLYLKLFYESLGVPNDRPVQ